MEDTTDVEERYVFGEELGEGNFSTVFKCLDKISDKQYASKVVKCEGNQETAKALRNMLVREVSIMRKLHHENLVQCLESFFGDEKIVLILEYTEEGDLYDFIINASEIPEGIAKGVTLDISNAVNYLHSKNIVHRDIKPENFLLFPAANDRITVKLCDFGLAIEAEEPLTEICGSPSYVAPEILHMHNYGLPVDIWSCGVVIYILLCQFPPFRGETNKELFRKIKNGKYEYVSPYWDDITENAKDIVSKMLEINPDRRLTAKEVANHPWLKNELKATGSTERKPSKLTLKTAAIAVCTAKRFSHMIEGPQREVACLSKTIVKDTFKEIEQLSDDI